jgi:hypothetical protein
MVHLGHDDVRVWCATKSILSEEMKITIASVGVTMVPPIQIFLQIHTWIRLLNPYVQGIIRLLL